MTTDKQKAYSKKYYREHRDEVLARSKKRQIEKKEEITKYNREWNQNHPNKRFVEEYKKNHPCELCGYSDPRALEFHHRNPEDKEFLVSSACRVGIDELKEEMAKCMVICANCHRILHFDENKNGKRSTA
jgi:hypothetical protein